MLKEFFYENLEVERGSTMYSSKSIFKKTGSLNTYEISANNYNCNFAVNLKENSGLYNILFEEVPKWWKQADQTQNKDIQNMFYRKIIRRVFLL